MAEQTGKVIIENARLSFAHLFEPVEEEKDDGSKVSVYKANFLIPKNKAEQAKVTGVFGGQRMPIFEALRLAGEQAMAKKFKTDDPTKWPKIGKDKKYLRDGDEKDYDGYAGQHYMSAKTDLKNPPSVLTNRKKADGKWVRAEPGGEGAPYSGCYVNAIVQVWIMDHKKYGKRVCLSLQSVQFRRDGEAFSGRVNNPDEDFTDDMVDGEFGSFGDDELEDDVI